MVIEGSLDQYIHYVIIEPVIRLITFFILLYYSNVLCSSNDIISFKRGSA
jgi:hypothetical protein